MTKINITTNKNKTVVNTISTKTVKIGTAGPQGASGAGVAAGGSAGDILVRGAGPDYTTAWTAIPTVDKLAFDISAAVAAGHGELSWNSVEGTLNLGTSGVTYQLGQELSFKCKNVSASTISDGVAVMFAGADSTTGYLEIVPMVANGSVPGYVFFGVTTESIAVGSVGYVTTLGKVRGIDTSAFPEDSLLWLNPSTPGAFQLTEPAAPNLKIAAAAVIKSDSVDGVIFVRAETGRNIADCHDVEIGVGAADEEYLGWSETYQRWQPLPVPNVAPRSITIVQPQVNDSFTLFRTSRETTITSVVGLVQGSSPNIIFELRYASDRSATGTLATSSTTITNTTTGAAATILNQPIPSGRYVWLDVTGVSGTVDEFNVSIAF